MFHTHQRHHSDATRDMLESKAAVASMQTDLLVCRIATSACDGYAVPRIVSRLHGCLGRSDGKELLCGWIRYP